MPLKFYWLSITVSHVNDTRGIGPGGGDCVHKQRVAMRYIK